MHLLGQNYVNSIVEDEDIIMETVIEIKYIIVVYALFF